MSGLKECMGWDLKVALVFGGYEAEMRTTLTAFTARWMTFKLRYRLLFRSYRRFCRSRYELQISGHFLLQKPTKQREQYLVLSFTYYSFFKTAKAMHLGALWTKKKVRSNAGRFLRFSQVPLNDADFSQIVPDGISYLTFLQCNFTVNPWSTKLYLYNLKIQFVPRSKHFLPRL